jgi:hypothetical protein
MDSSRCTASAARAVQRHAHSGAEGILGCKFRDNDAPAIRRLLSRRSIGALEES